MLKKTTARRPVARQTFEQGTGYAPELLAERTARELRGLLRQRRYDKALPGIIADVAARAERCWAAQPRWRTRWAHAGRAGNAAPLLMFFRHWTASATIRRGIALPDTLLDSFALGLAPARPLGRSRSQKSPKTQPV